MNIRIHASNFEGGSGKLAGARVVGTSASVLVEMLETRIGRGAVSAESYTRASVAAPRTRRAMINA